MTRFIKKKKDIGVACTINTEIGAVLAALRNNCKISTPEDYYYHDAAAQQIQSLKSLRRFIFNPQQEWKYMDPSIYLSPFLDIIQADKIPASATSVALSSVLKLTRLEIFDENTPGAKEAMNALVTASTSCRLERSDPVSEEGVLMKILQLLTGIMTHPTSCLLRDQSVCTVINTCFQVVQQSATKGNLLQKTAKHTMHEITQMVFSKLNDIEVRVGENSESDSEDIDDDDGEGGLRCGYYHSGGSGKHHGEPVHPGGSKGGAKGGARHGGSGKGTGGGRGMGGGGGGRIGGGGGGGSGGGIRKDGGGRAGGGGIGGGGIGKGGGIGGGIGGGGIGGGGVGIGGGIVGGGVIEGGFGGIGKGIDGGIIGGFGKGFGVDGSGFGAGGGGGRIGGVPHQSQH